VVVDVGLFDVFFYQVFLQGLAVVGGCGGAVVIEQTDGVQGFVVVHGVDVACQDGDGRVDYLFREVICEIEYINDGLCDFYLEWGGGGGLF
jgi:hypothetical protein